LLKRVLLPLVILSVAIAIFMALSASKPEKKALQRPEKVWRVNTVSVQFKQISPEITVYGRVETPRRASLNAALSADVSQVNILEGAVVSEGDVLISLDNSDADLLLNQREADLAEVNASISSEVARQLRDKNLLSNEQALLSLAEKAVTRAKKLDASRLVTRSSLDDVVANQQRQIVTLKRLEHDISEHPARMAGLKARQSRAKALLSQAQLDVDRAFIKAPFNGRIANLSVSLGDRVRVGDNLLSIYDLDHLEVRAQIPGRYLKQIRDDLTNGKTPKAVSVVDERVLTFELNRLSGETRQDSGGVDGLFSLVKDQQSTLALGTFIELSLTLGTQDNVIVMPFNALYGLNRVYRIKDGYLEAVKISRVGEYENSDGQTQLLIRGDDLNEGDRVVSTQLPNAITGLRVEAMNDDT
jgi:multidrug efflux pump subunit AcrA (membrane-fusion protein)